MTMVATETPRPKHHVMLIGGKHDGLTLEVSEKPWGGRPVDIVRVDELEYHRDKVPGADGVWRYRFVPTH